MINSRYRPQLLNVDKPGRYVGGEFGSCKPKLNAPARIALAFPDTYEVGMSTVGLSILYEIINTQTAYGAERAYMPWPDMMTVMQQHDLPLESLESGTILKDFDMVGFSLQYELCFTNVLWMLKLGQIPLRATQRGPDDPLVVVGGPVAVQAEALGPFVDLVLPGDGEVLLKDVLDQYAALRSKMPGTMNRTEIINALAQHPSVYAPNTIARDAGGGPRGSCATSPQATVATIANLSPYPTGAGPVASIQSIFDRYSVEIGRGCTQGCRFCQAGYLYRPVRERTTSEVGVAMDKAVSCLGFDEISLLSLSSADHSEIDSLITGLGTKQLDNRVSFSVPSLRAYGLSEESIKVLSSLRASGVTLAPEAGTQRLRDVINKNITENDLMTAAERFFKQGFSRIKLYFMLGLPTETDDDLREIVELAGRMQKLGRTLVKKRVDVVVSVSTFVPKPFTPFEREAMINKDEIIRRQIIVRDAGRQQRISVKTHNPNISVLEGVFARGGIELASLIETAVERGACFEGWDELFNAPLWDELLQTVDVDAHLAAIDQVAPVPWNVLDAQITKSFRENENQKGKHAELTAPCGVFVDEDGNEEFICYHCGAKCKRSRLPVKTRRVVTEGSDTGAPAPRRPKPAVVKQASAAFFKYEVDIAFHGPWCYVGHLDRVKQIMRTFRRAGVEIWYTEGFHPKPKMETPPPVPLGTAGLAEPFDVYLANKADETTIDKLNAAAPDAMRIVNLTPLAEGAKKLSKRFNAVEYVVLINREESAVKTAIQQLMSTVVLPVTRIRKKKKPKDTDIRPYLLEASLASDYNRAIFPVSDRPAVQMTLALPGSGGTRPSELLEQVLDNLEGDDLWIARTRFLLREDVAE